MTKTTYIFTFCVNINKHSIHTLSRAFSIFCKALHNNLKKYKLVCYTNFNLSNPFPNNIELRNYYYNSSKLLYNNDPWLNLSFNKINIYKDLHTEFNEDFIWIDLDTYILTDISYMNDLDHVFIENGGDCTNPNLIFRNNDTLTIPRNRNIQGDLWKININLYEELMNTLNTDILEKKLILQYDCQSLFNYYVYIKNENNRKINTFNILGNTIKPNTINGLGVWDKSSKTHATENGLNNIFYNTLTNTYQSKLHPNKNIDIISFTFITLIQLWNKPQFNKIFEEYSNKQKIGVFGTCRVDYFDGKLLEGSLNNYPFIYSTNTSLINVRPLGYTVSSSEILQNLTLIKNDKEKNVDKRLYNNVFLKHHGKRIIRDINYDYLILEICSIKKIRHIQSSLLFPYEVEGYNFNKNEFVTEHESSEETIQNIRDIQSMIECKIILLPPIINFNCKPISGVHEGIVPEKVIEYRKEIINRLILSQNEHIFFYDWNNILTPNMLKDQFHFTDEAKKIISSNIYELTQK